MTTSRAVWTGAKDGREARCVACREPLADEHGYLPLSLIPRSDRHVPTGLPRYGPPARPRHRGSRHAGEGEGWRSGFADISPGMQDAPAFYVNCPACDRGQIVDFGDLAVG